MLDLNPRRFRREPSMQYLLANSPAFPAPRVRATGAPAPGRAARARLYLLGAIHRHALLPVGAGAFVARNLRRFGRLRRQAAASGSARDAQALHARWPMPTNIGPG